MNLNTEIDNLVLAALKKDINQELIKKPLSNVKSKFVDNSTKQFGYKKLTKRGITI